MGLFLIIQGVREGGVLLDRMYGGMGVEEGNALYLLLNRGVTPPPRSESSL